MRSGPCCCQDVLEYSLEGDGVVQLYFYLAADTGVLILRRAVDSSTPASLNVSTCTPNVPNMCIYRTSAHHDNLVSPRFHTCS